MPKTLLFGKLNGNKVFSEEKIAKICEGFHMEYKFANRIIFVNTQIAYWRIHHNGEKILNIFHENYRTSGSKSGKKKRKCNDGFHKQAVKFDDFFEALRYIYYHDKHFFVTGGKYSKLDKLFAKIETEKSL